MLIDLLIAIALLLRGAIYLRIQRTGERRGQALPEHALVTGVGSIVAAMVFVVAAAAPGSDLWIELAGLAVFVATTRLAYRGAGKARRPPGSPQGTP